MRNLTTALLCLSLAVPAALTAQTATVGFTNGGSLTGHYVSDGKYYVGNYSGTVDGQDVSLNCVDFFHEVTNGQVWQANVTNLASGNMTNTYYGSVEGYQQAAFLTTFYAGANDQATIDIQHAIWRIIGNNDPARFGTDASALFTAGADAWVTCAASKYNSGVDCNGNAHVVNYSQFELLSDTGKKHQEFLTTTTPEPSSMALLGTGLFGLVPMFRRKRK